MLNFTKKHEIIPVIMKSSNGELVVSSSDIASGICKEHKDILKKIRENLNERDFSLVEYIDNKGEKRPEYLLPKDSFILYQGYNYRGRCDGRYSQILDSYAVKELTGEHILPLQERIEHYYTAEEVGKNDKYGKWFIDKAKHTNKEVEAFRYNQAGIDCIKKMLMSSMV